MNFNIDEAVKEICDKKNIKENQFKDYLNAFGQTIIENEADKFIKYCEVDGWSNYSK